MLSSCYTRQKENELYQLITNATDLEPILEPFKISDRLAIDTKTTGLDPFTDRIRLLQLATDEVEIICVASADWPNLYHGNRFDMRQEIASLLAACYALKLCNHVNLYIRMRSLLDG